ncbi:MAG: LysM peptidoglycan-binding domain-containing protein [Acidobacteriota bacterium]
MAKKPMRRLLGTVAIVTIAMMLAPLADAQGKKPHRPPRGLHKVGDHWTPYDPPSSFPEGTKVYIIVQGDTLWDLSKANLGDPYLWPRIYEANPYIKDAHWIYPGDPLVIPGEMGVVPPNIPPGEPGAGGTPGGTPPIPVGYDWDVQCSGFISKDFHTDLRIIEQVHGDEGKIGSSVPEVVYANNPDHMVQAGSDYQVLRPMDHVIHPVTGDDLGRYYRLVGRVRAICTSDKSATMEIVESCQDVLVGDRLRPWEEVPIPIASVRTIDQMDRWCQEPSGKLKGYIVFTTDEMVSNAEGNVVNIDVGSDDNIAPGDFFTIYKHYDKDHLYFAGWRSGRDPKGDYENDDLPRLVLGELVVLLTEKHTATARITTSMKQVEIGAKVELVAR